MVDFYGKCRQIVHIMDTMAKAIFLRIGIPWDENHHPTNHHLGISNERRAAKSKFLKGGSNEAAKAAW